jgi:hypothetical protein
MRKNWSPWSPNRERRPASRWPLSCLSPPGWTRYPSEERQTLQVAAVFGSVLGGWDTRLLVQDVTEPLEALEQKVCCAPNRAHYPGEHEYAFKHDLICEVAYEMLPGPSGARP